MVELNSIAIDGNEYRIVLPNKDTDYIQGGIAKEGVPYELAMLRSMASKLKKGDLVLDVGANIGNHTLYLAAVCGCCVQAFEPNDKLCRALKESVEANGLSEKVDVYSLGVGKHSGKGRFSHIDPENLGAQSIEITNESDATIEVVKLDDRTWPATVRAIKIDVEGMEMDVLHGAEQLIKRDQPVIYIECQSYDQYREVEEWLMKYGYGYMDTFNATPTHLFLPLSSIDENERVKRFISKIQEQEYELKSQLSSTRKKLHDANMKYRNINNEVKELKKKFDDFRRESWSLLMESQKHDKKILEELEEKYRSAEEDLDRYNKKIRKLTASLTEVNYKYRLVTSTQVSALKDRLERQDKQLSELQKLSQQQAEALKQAYKEQALAKRRLSELRSSVTYKAGQHMRAAASSWRDAIKLPIRLLRIMRQPRRSTSSRVGSEKKATHNNPSSGTSAKPKEQELTTWNETQKEQVERLDAAALIHKPASKIRVACIMDDFTFGSYQPECELYQLTPEHWQAELEASQPELLFIESAWRGKEEQWGSKVGHTSQELQGIVKWCRERCIPAIFWNKEDPIHFETFLNTARLFDFVFTTDIDCIHRYKAALGHENVYLLPFACQPEVHNPIEKYERKDAFCFAGAYYVRYPERTRDLESFVKELPSFRPLEIYDRNYGKDDPNYQFPEAYQPYIVGTLPFDQIDKAYKGYRYAINLNSIKQSQTMFARRVFELLASNTLTVSNYSRGVRLMKK